LSRLLFLAAVLVCTACSTQPSTPAGPTTADLPVSDIIQPKLAPQSGIDPTVTDPLVQRRCDFAADLPIDKGWFASGNTLTADGRIALARSVLGPTAECRRVELLSVTILADSAQEANRAKLDAERRAEQVRQFFASHGIAPERIEARAGNCSDQTSTCWPAHITVQVRGVAR
jgi:hypothetical protein